jgi:hypothetical protein
MPMIQCQGNLHFMTGRNPSLKCSQQNKMEINGSRMRRIQAANSLHFVDDLSGFSIIPFFRLGNP